MKFKLSSHGAKRLKQRKIKLEWLQMALESPDAIEADEDDDTILHVLKAIPEKGFKRLRVIYNETTEPVTIVTAYFD